MNAYKFKLNSHKLTWKEPFQLPKLRLTKRWRASILIDSSWFSRPSSTEADEDDFVEWVFCKESVNLDRAWEVETKHCGVLCRPILGFSGFAVGVAENKQQVEAMEKASQCIATHSEISVQLSYPMASRMVNDPTPTSRPEPCKRACHLAN